MLLEESLAARAWDSFGGETWCMSRHTESSSGGGVVRWSLLLKLSSSFTFKHQLLQGHDGLVLLKKLRVQ